MWASIGTGLGAVTVFGLIVRFQQARITKLDEDKIDKDMCIDRRANFDEALLRGDKRFEKIDKTQTKILEIVNGQTTSIALVQQALERIEVVYTKE